MLRRNTPYGNIIYMLIQLKVTRTSFLADLFSRSIYMKRVQIFNGRYTKGVSFVKHSIFKGKGLYLGAKTLRTKLYWVVSHTPPLLSAQCFSRQCMNFLWKRSYNLRQKPWSTLENSAPFCFPPPFCNVVVATQLCNNISTLQAERDVHRCFKDFWRGLCEV